MLCSLVELLVCIRYFHGGTVHRFVGSGQPSPSLRHSGGLLCTLTDGLLDLCREEFRLAPQCGHIAITAVGSFQDRGGSLGRTSGNLV